MGVWTTSLRLSRHPEGRPISKFRECWGEGREHGFPNRLGWHHGQRVGRLLWKIRLMMERRGTRRSILSAPPGCSGAKEVKSHTWLSITSQQSLMVLCLSISSVEINFVEVMVGGMVFETIAMWEQEQ